MNAGKERIDTVIQGGRLIDPAQGLDGAYDIAIADGKVSRIAPGGEIEAGVANVIDAAEQIVTPGLIDLHTHVYWGATYWGIEPDPLAWQTGVTTWLDVGSAGAYNFPGFRRYVAEASRARVYALLNLSSIGLVGPSWEFANLDYCDLELAARMVKTNRDLVLGVKARIDGNTTRSSGIRPLEMARALADRVGLPLMVHIGSGPPTLADVANLLRPGDILTHCFTGGDMRILDASGTVNPAIAELQSKGLVLDIGHGAGSFSYEVTEALLNQGVLPDVISSDIHQMSRLGPCIDLPTTLSKFLNLGLSLPDVVARATSHPAAAMGRPDLGTLRPGSPADIALWRVEEGKFTFHDVTMSARTGNVRLTNTLTLLDGLPMAKLPEREPHVWAR
jgi:dihydroorotase